MRYRGLLGRIAPFILLAAVCSGEQSDFTVRLESRHFTPQAGIAKGFLDSLAGSPAPRLHALVQLWQRPERETRDYLATRGVKLLYHVHANLWVAAVDKGFASDAGIAALVRWSDALQPADKVPPALAAGQCEQWAVRPDGQLLLAVEFYRDVDPAEAHALLQPRVAKLEPSQAGGGWHVVAPAAAVWALAGADQVKHVRCGPEPFMPLNNFTRAATRVEQTQLIDLTTTPPSYRLSGAGVQIGFWDSGIEAGHPDFGSRVLRDAPDSSRLGHGTAVAGVLAGDGSVSDAEGHTPFLYRGMAPEAELIAYYSSETTPYLSDVADAIGELGMDVSNHSYVLSLSGNYTASTRFIDELIRGASTLYDTPVPARAMVFGVGNNGTIAQFGVTRGYFSVLGPAKNSLTIGAVAAEYGTPYRLWQQSSLGPTWDGRIKPDLVAPGESIMTTARFETSGDYGYWRFDGTSLSAPAVTGTLALLLEQYAALGVELDAEPPLPSTLKAILIQTATDQVHTTPTLWDWTNPDTGAAVLYHEGPDYATGYGLVNAQAATSLVREDNVREGSISTRTDRDTYTFPVAPGTPRIQFTLAWDDEPYEDMAAAKTEPRIVNDLELVLIDPTGRIHLPWLLAPLTPAAVAGEDDPIEAADITAARPGFDHRNNVEQVTVNEPVAGRWHALVRVAATSPGLLDDPQPYSLAGDYHAEYYIASSYLLRARYLRIRAGDPAPVEATRGREIHHAGFGLDGALYFSEVNGSQLYRLDAASNQAVEVYKHWTTVRDVGLDPAGRLHFSEASGAGADGTIYRVLPGTPVKVEVLYRVRRAEVDGYWGGDFAFDASGRLFLSTGNRPGAHIYRVDDPAAGKAPIRIHTQPNEGICGIAFDREGRFHYSGGSNEPGTLYRLDLATHRRVAVHSFPGSQIWDVSFR